MVFNIVLEPSPTLHDANKIIDPKEILSRPIQKLMKDMVETMYVKDGVGLAAPQIGKNIMLCVITKAYNTATINEDLCLINPTWLPLTKSTEVDEEGCLSVPGQYGKIGRFTKIKVSALNKKGAPLEFVAEDFFARIVQHEVDHLQGHLYIERATDLRPAESKKPASKYPRK